MARRLMAGGSEGGLRNYPLVSIIIPTFNSGEMIGACLKSIGGQTYPNIEVIVVDRYSNDGTREIAEKFNAKTLLMNAERSAARNRGVTAAKGSFVFFLDSDMELTPRVVEECVTACLKKVADAVIIPEMPVAQGFLGECRKIEKELFIGDRLSEIPRFFRKEAFLKVGGFDECLTYGEDADLYVRLDGAGYKTRRIKAEVRHYEGALSLRQIVFKAHNYGKSLPLFIRKNLSLAVKRSSLVRMLSGRNLKLLLRRPANFLGLIFMKFVEYVGYLTGISARFLGFFWTKWGRISANFAILTFLAVIIFRNFLFTSEWPAGGDVLGWISRAYLFGKDFRWLYLWRPYSFGFVEGISSLDFFLWVIYLVCRDASSTIKIFMFSSFLMAGFSMYAFAYRYTRRHLAALSASMVYTLNPWIFCQFSEAHVDILFGYALAPLLFLFLDKALETGKFRDILALAAAFSVCVTGFYPGSIVIYGVFLAMFVVFYLFFPAKSSDFCTRIKRFSKALLLGGIIFFLLSAFWLVPFFFNVRSYYYSSAFGYPLEWIYTYENMAEAFTLTYAETWGYSKVVNTYAAFPSVPDLPVSTILLYLFFLAYCTILLRRDRYTAFFAVSAFVSLFISKGPYPPFGDIFVWAWFNIPHFSVFRAASRWVMMAAFSHAFFISVLVSILTNYVQKSRRPGISEVFLRIKTKFSEGAQTEELYVSFDFLNKVAKVLHRFLYYLSVTILILIFVSGFFSCFFFFTQGLQVYTPPQSYMEPYRWIAGQPDDYKIVTVPRSVGEWMGWPGARPDLGHSAMLTDLGWGHDIGFDSSFIHDRPTLQDGGWQPLSRAFVDHLRYQLASEYMTDDLLKMLGVFNYKYVVLPPYAPTGMQDFFLNQQGARVIYNQDDSIVLENYYNTPRIFVATRPAIVVGGLESFFSLCKIDSLNLNKTAFIFAHQIDELSASLNSSEALIFVDSDILDLVMLHLKDDLINAVAYSAPSSDSMKYWAQSPLWRRVGRLTLGEDTLSTYGKNTVQIPFKVETDETYDFWIRVGFAPDRGKLSIFIDGALKEEISPSTGYWLGLKWINVARLDLKSGNHIITLTNDGTGFNDVDAIAIIKPSRFQSAMEAVLRALQNFSGRLINVLRAENTFNYGLSRGWYILQSPYNGFVLHTYGGGENVSPEGTVTASSIRWGFKPENAIDGRLDTRWASAYLGGMPQWLQVEWPAPQELVGVHLLFERAFAINYTIQTWNGRDWVDAMNVTGNTLLERFHCFRQPLKTMKLRIYFTADIGYKHVSLWELEAYTRGQPTISAKVEIPREGYYKFALRLASGSDYGTLNFTINNFTATFPCSDPNLGFKWYEIQPDRPLKFGEQEITLSAKGPIGLDEMIIYSLKDGEGNVSLSSLFEASSAPPSVSKAEKISPVEYRVHVKSGEPFLLIFSEAHHPLWRAYVDGQEVSPIITYFLVNGFFINKTGEFNITLYFIGQTYANVGLIISGSTLITLLTYFTLQFHPKWRQRKSEQPSNVKLSG